MSRIGHPKRTAGYTLLELAVAISIVSLMAVTLPLAYENLWPGAELKAATSDLRVALIRLRTEAKTEGHPTGLTAGDQPGTMVFLPSGRQFTPDEEIEFSVVPNRQDSQSPMESTFVLTFFPNGTSTGGVITLREGERQTRIEVDWLTSAITGGGDV